MPINPIRKVPVSLRSFLAIALSAISVGFGCATSGHSPRSHILRFKPGQDVLKELLAYANRHSLDAASVVSSVGSLSQYNLRFANQKVGTMKSGHFEVVSLSGTISASGPHLHMAVSNGSGTTIGGHLLDGNIVYTTLELALLEYPGLKFSRIPDATTGYKELKIEAK